jgi:hypothetical protein
MQIISINIKTIRNNFLLKPEYPVFKSWININDEISKGKTVLRGKAVKSKQKEIEN